MLEGRLTLRGAVLRGDQVRLVVDGLEVTGLAGETIAAALLAHGRSVLRLSRRRHEPRGLYCGMGICHECLVIVDGTPNVRACLTSVRDGQVIDTKGGDA